jgi:hypothetical protein
MPRGFAWSASAQSMPKPAPVPGGFRNAVPVSTTRRLQRAKVPATAHSQIDLGAVAPFVRR